MHSFSFSIHSARSIVPLGAMVLLLLIGDPVRAQTSSTAGSDANRAVADTAKNQSDRRHAGLQPLGLPKSLQSTIASLNVRDGDLRDVFRGIAAQYDVNLAVDSRIEQSVTIRLADLTVLETIEFLCTEYGLDLQQSGTILRIRKPAVPPPPPLDVRLEDDVLWIDVRNAPIRKLARRLSEVGSSNVVVGRSVEGVISGYLEAAPFETGLRTLLRNHGFDLQEDGGIYTIIRGADPSGASPSGRSYAMQVTVRGDRVDLVLREADIHRVIAEIARQTDLELITYQQPKGRITAEVTDLGVDEAFAYLLRGTDVTYRQDETRYVLAGKDAEGMARSRLIRLQHIPAETLAELLPEALLEEAAVKVVKEQNGIMVTGPTGALDEIEAFTRQVDNPTPQIMIEALVVDFEDTNMFELGVEFGKLEDGEVPDVKGERYRFDDDGYQLEAEGRQVTEYKNSIADFLGWDGLRNIGRLPQSFFLDLHALAQEGKANIRSRPQISTLNGHPARISIGTTQFFILRGATHSGNTAGGYVPIETERFERVEANVTLDITPRVTASGEVTVEIRPEFSTPVGQFDPGVPPTINTRVVESTVRLRDGETIILGGLIQESERVQINKVPLLGQIPGLGRLFRNRSRSTRKSELAIFITPHVFHGGNSEQEKWMELRDRYDAGNEK